MFLLRCAFWLSVVYAAMFFGLPGETAAASRRPASMRGSSAARSSREPSPEPPGRAVAANSSAPVTR